MPRLRIDPAIKHIANIYSDKVQKTVINATKARINQDSLKLITKIGDDMREQIAQVLREGEEQGRSIAATASKLLKTGLDKGVFSSARKRAYLIARTELHRARQRAAVDLYKAGKIRFVRWIGIPDDGRICAECKALHGKHFRLDQIEDKLPPKHPRCRCRILPAKYQLELQPKNAGVSEMKITPIPDDYKYVIKIGKISKSLEKSRLHKYIRREGPKGKYKYFYSEPEPETVFHGTSVENLYKILFEGVKPQKYHNWSENFYEGEREKSVFVAIGERGFGMAKEFAEFAEKKTGKVSIIIEAKIPINYWKKNRKEDNKVFQPSAKGPTGFMLPEVKPEWITNLFDQDGNVMTKTIDSLRLEYFKKAEEDTVTVYIPMTLSNLRKMFLEKSTPPPGPANTFWEGFEGNQDPHPEANTKARRKIRKEPSVAYGGEMYSGTTEPKNPALPVITKSLDDYSCVLTFLKPLISHKVTELLKQIDPKDLHKKTEEEDKPHITVRYGLHTEMPEEVKEVIRGEEMPLKASIVGLDVFQPEGKDYDVLVLRANSPALEELNDKLGGLPNTETFKFYQPHITIAYLKRDAGDKYRNMVTGLEGKWLTFDTLEFSDRKHHLTEIEKARSHKYIRREGTPGHYQYFYQEDEWIKKVRGEIHTAEKVETVERVKTLVKKYNLKSIILRGGGSKEIGMLEGELATISKSVTIDGRAGPITIGQNGGLEIDLEKIAGNDTAGVYDGYHNVLTVSDVGWALAHELGHYIYFQNKSWEYGQTGFDYLDLFPRDFKDHNLKRRFERWASDNRKNPEEKGAEFQNAVVDLMVKLGDYYDQDIEDVKNELELEMLKFPNFVQWMRKQGGIIPEISDFEIMANYELNVNEMFARVVHSYVAGHGSRGFEYTDEYMAIVNEFGDKWLKTGIFKSLSKGMIMKSFYKSSRPKMYIKEGTLRRLVRELRKARKKYVPYKTEDGFTWAKKDERGLIVSGTEVGFKKGDQVLLKNGDVGFITAVGKDGVTARGREGDRYEILNKSVKIIKSRRLEK